MVRELTAYEPRGSREHGADEDSRDPRPISYTCAARTKFGCAARTLSQGSRTVSPPHAATTYARAQVGLASAYVLLPSYSYEDPAEMYALAEKALDSADRLSHNRSGVRVRAATLISARPMDRIGNSLPHCDRRGSEQSGSAAVVFAAARCCRPSRSCVDAGAPGPRDRPLGSGGRGSAGSFGALAGTRCGSRERRGAGARVGPR